MSQPTKFIPNEADLKKLSELNKLPEALEDALPAICYDIRELWKLWNIRVDAFETGALLRDIKSTRISAREFVTGADLVDQDFFVEFGVRGKDYEGRHTLKRALDEMDQRDDVERRISAAFDRVLKHGKRGF